MDKYYIHKIAKENGSLEVHKENCCHLPDKHDCEYLGIFANCTEALVKARERYEKCFGCKYCMTLCYKK